MALSSYHPARRRIHFILTLLYGWLIRTGLTAPHERKSAEDTPTPMSD